MGTTRKLLGPEPPQWFWAVSDGCTMSPDGIWRDACVYHDWLYRVEQEPPVSRWQADWWFARNLVRCGCPVRWAWKYWAAVRCYSRHLYLPQKRSVK